MLILAAADLRAAAADGGHRRRHARRGPARHRRGVRRRPAGAAPAPRPGRVAANLRALLAGSPIVASHRGPADTRVQDAYSLRCSPQVHGAARDTLAHARTVAESRAGQRHRQPGRHRGRPGACPTATSTARPVAYVLDFLAIAAADVASIAERRTDRMLDAARSHGLPPFLADDPGVDSGHMIAQYTQAAIVSELKRLAVPASVDSIPSSAMQEDHVSMGWSAARKLRRAVDGADPGAGHRAAHRRPGARPARAARRPPRPPARSSPGCAPRGVEGPAPTASWPRRSRRPSARRLRRRRPRGRDGHRAARLSRPAGAPAGSPGRNWLATPAERGTRQAWKAPAPSAPRAAPRSPPGPGRPRPRCAC